MTTRHKQGKPQELLYDAHMSAPAMYGRFLFSKWVRAWALGRLDTRRHVRVAKALQRSRAPDRDSVGPLRVSHRPASPVTRSERRPRDGGARLESCLNVRGVAAQLDSVRLADHRHRGKRPDNSEATGWTDAEALRGLAGLLAARRVKAV